MIESKICLNFFFFEWILEETKDNLKDNIIRLNFKIYNNNRRMKKKFQKNLKNANSIPTKSK